MGMATSALDWFAVLLVGAAVAGCGQGGGPPCVKDSIKKHDGGKVTECELSEDFTISEVKCAAKKKIQTRADGSLKSCELAQPVEVQGFPCKSGTLSFDDKGKVYFCSATSKDIKVGDVVVPAGSLINPFGSGRVKFAECRGKNATYKGLTCKEVHFDDAGKLKRCKLAADAKWKGNDVKAGAAVELGPTD
jgi:hypothetical protein